MEAHMSAVYDGWFAALTAHAGAVGAQTLSQVGTAAGSAGGLAVGGAAAVAAAQSPAGTPSATAETMGVVDGGATTASSTGTMSVSVPHQSSAASLTFISSYAPD